MIPIKTDQVLINRALIKLGENSEDLRPVLVDLVRSGFDEVDELVELANVKRTTGGRTDRNVEQ